MTARKKPRFPMRYGALAASALLAACATPGTAQAPQPDTPAAASPTGPTYADLVQLAETAEIVAVAAIADQIAVEPERAPGLEPGRVRLYLEADTEALLAGPGALGESFSFLADRMMADRGRAPDLEDQRFLLFARPVPGRPAMLQLAAPASAAMLPADPALVDRTRGVLRQLAGPESLPEVTGVREVISIAGNLAGESETQLFLETRTGAPVSLTVLRRPGEPPEWGVSWTEIVDQSADAPAPETLEWYRLACFLPPELPGEAFLQDDGEARARARDDYEHILDELGPCDRRLT